MGTYQRAREQFREDLRKSMVNFNDMRLLSNRTLGRHVDADVVNKCRLSLYGQQTRMVNKMVNRSGEEEDMERCRSTKGDYRLDAREWALGDNVAAIYFNYYGHGFYGDPIVDNPQDGWTCPKCHLKYSMSLKTLPEYCKRCDHITPIGEMVRDKVMRR